MSREEGRPRLRRRSSLLSCDEEPPEEDDPRYRLFWSDIRLQLARLKASRRKRIGVSSDAVSRSSRSGAKKVGGRPL